MKRVFIGLALLLLVTAPAAAQEATPVPEGGGTPAQTINSTYAVIWQNYDVTLNVQPDGRVVVTERQVVLFNDGPYRTAFATISTDHIDALTDVGVAEVVDGVLEPYQPTTASGYSEAAQTFRARETSSEVQIDWAFPSTTGASRTFVLTYIVSGAIRSYPDNVPANQVLWWNAIPSGVSEAAPVENATATIILPEAVPLDQTLVDQYSDGTNVPANFGQDQDVANNNRYSTDGQTWTFRASDLEDGEGVFVRLQFPPILDSPIPSWQLIEDAQAEAVGTPHASE